jgi:hypothetical protein
VLLGLLRVRSEFVPQARVPGPGLMDHEGLGCSVAVVAAPRCWTWVPLYTLRGSCGVVERSMKIERGVFFNS